MDMITLVARINKALEEGKINQTIAEQAQAAIRAPKRMGATMTPAHRDSILTHRFGI